MANRSNDNNDDVACDLLSARTGLAEHLRIKLGEQKPVRLNILNQKSYPYSVICLVEAVVSDFTVGRYYIKRLLLRASGRVGAQKQCIQEARLLRQLNDRMPAETVELVLVLPEQLVIITAECAGVSFSRLLRWYSVQCFHTPYREKLALCSVRCGDWLHRFHADSRTSSDGLPGWIDYLSGEVEWRIKELTSYDPTNAAMYAAVADKLEGDLKSLQSLSGTSMIHRDFAPHNIFIDTNHIQILDFSDVQDGHGLIDVINYIASLASRCENRLVATSLIQEMCRVFIQAYGGIPDDDVGIFNSLLVLQSLKRLLVLYQSRSAFPWDSVIKSGKSWHVAFLGAYLRAAHEAGMLLKGPWPFLDLAHVQAGR